MQIYVQFYLYRNENSRNISMLKAGKFY